MKKLHMVTWTLVMVGGLNWLLQGVLGWDIGSLLPEGMAGLYARVLYILVGLSAVYEIATHSKTCKLCGKAASAAPSMPAM